MVGALLLGSCADPEEETARKLFEAAQQMERAKEYTKALRVYRDIEKKYPESEAAAKVAQVVNYELIEQALAVEKNKYIDEVRDSMRVLAKAVESYHFKNDDYPPTLEALVPEYLPAVPRDPWGARFSYGRLGPDGMAWEDTETPGTNYLVAWFGKDRLPGGTGDNRDLFIKDGHRLN